MKNKKLSKVRFNSITVAGKTHFMWLTDFVAKRQRSNQAIGSFDASVGGNYDVLLLGHENSEVNPYLYDDIPRADGLNKKEFNLARDRIALSSIAKAVARKKKIIGVGRGAHECCIAAGSPLIQKVSGHSGIQYSFDGYRAKMCTHEASFFDRSIIDIESSHDSMMYPYVNFITGKRRKKIDYEILAWSSESFLSGNEIYLSNRGDEPSLPPQEKELFCPDNEVTFAFGDGRVEPEIVFFRNINALAIQPNVFLMYQYKLRFSTALIEIGNIIKMFLEDKL